MSPIPPPPPPPPFASPCIRYTLYLASFLLISTFTSSFLHLSSPLPSSQINLPSSSRPFTLQHSYSGPTFFDNFDFEAISDPTHGYVSYKTREEAERRNLTFVSQFGEEEAYLGMDRAEREPGWPGRASVRIRSKRGYESGMVLVVDVKHMPWGCGTWPALWMTSLTGWPNLGEIDIIENVHLASRNLYTLHTSAGCSLPPPGPRRRQSGLAKTNNCDVAAANQWTNEGCGVESSVDRTWGKGFNEDGGGIVVMKWTDEGIEMWQFRKGTEPLDLSVEGEEVDPETWGVPAASFPSIHCPPSHFRSQHIIINLSACGDWAGQPGIWASSGCLGLLDPNEWTCERSVREGKGLEDAFWAIRRMSVYRV
ncbi:concanavalin A-like lectin/glucanase domain-containing protein [Mrakia frigida]|uniref:glycoside hydrolase family 16 protein n=1 Tax=Mrakia frigida TaxID=29902 RepID=UPI003FCC111B